jgi:hypothetical protein
MFTTAGFNVNRLKMFIFEDDADPILKLRHETKIMRISTVWTKHNALFRQFTERIEIMTEKMLRNL